LFRHAGTSRKKYKNEQTNYYFIHILYFYNERF